MVQYPVSIFFRHDCPDRNRVGIIEDIGRIRPKKNIFFLGSMGYNGPNHVGACAHMIKKPPHLPWGCMAAFVFFITFSVSMAEEFFLTIHAVPTCQRHKH